MKKLLFLVFIILTAQKVVGQQDPLYTQYMYNMSVVNPAYVTDSPSVLNLGSLYRTQWVGVEGAPKTLTLFAHTPINKKMETGFSLISDDIGNGAKKETNIYADLAYKVQISEKQKIAFGVKAGFTSISTNFNGFALNSGSSSIDPAFSENLNKTSPNLGVGTYFYNNNYYVGFSIPNLLSANHISRQSETSSLGIQNIHSFLTGGYVFKLGDSFKLKPAAMAIFVKGAPISLDFTANVLFRNTFELGAAYRVGDAASVLMNVNVLPNLRVGYSYDYTLSNLSKFSSGSHEFVLLYNLDFLGKGYDKSPRFF